MGMRTGGRARSRRSQSPAFAMVLRLSVANHPCRLGDFSYVTINGKAGGNYEPPRGYVHAPLFEYYCGVLNHF